MPIIVMSVRLPLLFWSRLPHKARDVWTCLRKCGTRRIPEIIIMIVTINPPKLFPFCRWWNWNAEKWYIFPMMLSAAVAELWLNPWTNSRGFLKTALLYCYAGKVYLDCYYSNSNSFYFLSVWLILKNLRLNECLWDLMYPSSALILG